MTAKTLKIYYPLPHFPPVSLSPGCDLGCLHCQGHYLQGMTLIHSPQHLVQYGHHLSATGGTGLLLSGGFTRRGTLINLQRMLPGITQIKQETSLLVALHTGFVTQTLAEELKTAGIDMAFTHCIGDTLTIQEIMGLSATPHQYAETLYHLSAAGIPVSPHICTGLYHGKLRGESTALHIIRDTCTPAAIVITALCPTRGTPLEGTPGPTMEALQTVIQEAHTMFPTVEIALGCMRSRGDSIEHMALQAGVTRFTTPSKKFLEDLHTTGYAITPFQGCCGLPTHCEPHSPPELIPGHL